MCAHGRVRDTNNILHLIEEKIQPTKTCTYTSLRKSKLRTLPKTSKLQKSDRQGKKRQIVRIDCRIHMLD